MTQIFLGFLLAIYSLPAFAEPIVNRYESQLRISWRSASEGTWKLTDQKGNLCASGRMNIGENVLDFQKVDSTADLLFSSKSSDPQTIHATTPIPGQRKLSQLAKPDHSAVIYQLPPRTYLATGAGRLHAGKLQKLTVERLQGIKDLGVDYLWLTGIQEHAALNQTDPDVVKGDAGSYYAIYDNWDVSSLIGDLAAFEAAIERAHSVGLRVIMDFVPNHTARLHRTDVLCKQHLDFGINDVSDVFFKPNNNYFYIGDAFYPPRGNSRNGADGIFDTNIFSPGIQLEMPAKVTGNDIVSSSPQNSDWFETVKLNYGWDFRNRRGHFNPPPRTWRQMVDIGQYWLQKGVDGFRVDYAHAVPIDFWRYFVGELRQVQPEVFLLAEAYEKDERMKVPGFSYQAMLDAGFDSVYNSEVYWALHHEASNPGNVKNANIHRSAAMRPEIVRNGYRLTYYMENHDEERVASRHFAPWVSKREDRARIGLAYTAYVALFPGHLLMHGGQELQEDASVYGEYAGDNGRTSIFDFIYQPYTRTWLYGEAPEWMTKFRSRYKDLLGLKHRRPFNIAHSYDKPTFVDLDGANYYKEQSKFIASYVRFDGNERYLVVLNSDPFNSHDATIHFTASNGHDHLGVLNALGIENSDRRYKFEEVFGRKGWQPRDPAIEGPGHPGWALYKSGDIPSGIFLGTIPKATTYVFKVTPL